MAHEDHFWKLEHLTHAQLLESLGGVLRGHRRSLAQLVAHLGEVEDRRLHLEAAHGSMFAYCVERLGMSEDEACRRIELARLARKFPALFAELHSGHISLSVALVLKHMLTASNHLELLSAARGKCIRAARELVAERFPKADASSSIRKLPEPRPATAANPTEPSLLSAQPAPAQPVLPVLSPIVPSSRGAESVPASVVANDHAPDVPRLSPLARERQERSALPRDGAAPNVSRSRIEPLSAQRYRIQFTADTSLKQKLELARDLLRHRNPNGDLAPIVARALDLLIDDVLGRRFGAKARRKDKAPAEGAPTPTAPEQRVTSPKQKARRPHIQLSARRAVLERDGLSCSWVDDQGVRCGCRAWLELDHRERAAHVRTHETGPRLCLTVDAHEVPEAPREAGAGGNLRLLCRAHNLLAAEHAYGREHIERMSTRRRQPRGSLDPPT